MKSFCGIFIILFSFFFNPANSYSQETRDLKWTGTLNHWASSIKFSPDGKKIFSTDNSGKSIMWNAENGNIIWSNINTFRTECCNFSPDGRLVAYAYGKDTLYLCNADNGKIIWLNYCRDARTSDFAPDGSKIVTLGGFTDVSYVQVWDVKTGKLIWTGQHFGASNRNSVHFSPDGTKIISGSFDKKIKMWNADSGNLLWSGNFDDEIWGVTYSPDGSKVAAGDKSGNIKVFNSDTGEVVSSFKQNGSIVSINFSPDSKKIVYASNLGVINADNGSLLFSIFNAFFPVCFNPDGNKIISTGSEINTICIWNSYSGEKLWSATLPNTVDLLEYSPDGKAFASNCYDYKIRVWGIQKKLNLTAPSGNEIFRAGTKKIISWTQKNIPGLKLEYSTNNGAEWLAISDSVSAADSSYEWIVPSVNSNECKIKISDISNEIVFDESDGLFSIYTPAINITNPVFGEILKVRSSSEIKWLSSNVLNIKIEYSTDNGSSWNVITNDFNADQDKFVWTVPNMPSLLCKIKISDLSAEGGVTPIAYSPVFSIEKNIPKWYELFQNYPNPFNDHTIVSYQIPQSGIVDLKLFNMLGEEVFCLDKGYKEADKYELDLSGKNFVSGAYIYQLKVNGRIFIKKMILLK